MQHNIPDDDNPRTPAMAQAVSNCVHCGFCLPACPTYNVLGEEMDSPRGRIYLMKSVLEGELETEEAQPYIDRCLGCMACMPACPSGVAYGDLLVGYRSMTEAARKRPLMDEVSHRMVVETLPYPKRFKAAAVSGKLAKLMQSALPDTFATMLNLLPEKIPAPKYLPDVIPAQGEKRGKIALISGCVQQVLAPEINHAAAHLLANNGIEVVIPKGQQCCGSILLHVGEDRRAQQLAKRNFDVFPTDVDAYITTAAGCGSGINDYELVFKGTPQEQRATYFAEHTMDLSAYIAKVGLRAPQPLAKPLRVVYQDACHLLHAQGISQSPRDLLRAIPNLELVEIAEAGMCCGSAGTYNIAQPQIAAELGQRKVANILDTQPDVIVSGNIGCMMQLRTHLKQRGVTIPVMYIAELLLLAYRPTEGA